MHRKLGVGFNLMLFEPPFQILHPFGGFYDCRSL